MAIVSRDCRRREQARARQAAESIMAVELEVGRSGMVRDEVEGEAGFQIAVEQFTPLNEALTREWVDANGLGGWASSTATGTNTRRYHGLLVGSLRPPVDRLVFWSRNEETVEAGDERLELGTNLYPGAVAPRGFEALERFTLLPWPAWQFRRGAIGLRKEIFVEYGRNTTCVLYENNGDTPLTLEVRPLLAFRDYHSLTHENGGVNHRLDTGDGRVTVRPYLDLPSLHFHHSPALVEPSPTWYRNNEYPAEQERGQDWCEDLFSSFLLRFQLQPGERAYLGATLHEGSLDMGEIARREWERRRLPRRYPDPRVDLLAQTAESFIVERAPAGKTVLAGYHWFTDWGRDTMIALPGLALRNGCPDTAREILLQFARHLDRGMIPNRFPDRGEEVEYNTVDASLWFVHAVRQYFEASGDLKTLREELFPAVRAVIEGYRNGTRYGIRMEEDGLIHAGEDGTQLTWMDAKVGDFVVTPRIGKPVEISALWYDALRSAAELAAAVGEPDTYSELAERVRESFNAGFWNPETGCLYDVLGAEGPDPGIRPNQLLALSLRPDLLPEERRRSVLEVASKHLLTPFGLRSLSPDDSRYRPVYTGGQWKRDLAYHQGTVWGWLIGPYVDAVVSVYGLNDETRQAVARMIEPLLGHLHEAGLGSISEIFDANPPHTPRGCVSQAWSVAEVLRVYHKYLA